MEQGGVAMDDMMAIAGSVRQCAECAHPKSEVYDSRDISGRYLRRRKCKRCGARWATVEMPVAAYETITEAATKLAAAELAVATARAIVRSLERPQPVAVATLGDDPLDGLTVVPARRTG